MPQTNRTAVLWAALIANFLAAMEVTIVGTAMPTIVGVLQGLDVFTWVVTGYLLAQTITIPIYGKLADLYGRKRTFFVGATIFLIGSLLSGFATSMLGLVVARVIQGIGGGAILPVTITLIGDLFPGNERGKAQGLLASVWGISSILGPLLGVFIVSTLGWRWVFLINLPVGLLAMAALWITLHETIKPNPHGLDIPGAVLLASGVGVLLYAFRFSSRSWTDPTMLAFLALGAVLMALFVWQERRAPEPLLPLSLFRERLFTVATLSGFLSGFPLTSFFTFIPLFVQGALGGSHADNGRVLMAMSAAWSATSFSAGRWLYPRVGTRRPATWGMGLIVLGSVLMVMLNRQASLLSVAVAGGVTGLGFGLSVSAFVISVQESVGWNVRGVATSALQFSRNLGTAAGAAILGTIMNNILLPRLAAVPSLAAYTPQERLALTNAVLEPGGIAQVPQDVVVAMQGALADGIRASFWIVLAMAVAGFAVSLFVPLGSPVAGHGGATPSGHETAGHDPTGV